jgi:hypothetical protein
MKRIYFLLVNAVIILAFSSCKSSFQAEKPKESYLPSNIAPALSEFPIQIDIDVKKLETAINRKMTGVIYEGNNLNNQDLSVRVSKVQNFTFTVKNNVIEYRVPLKVWSRFAWKVEKFGLSVSDHYEANGSIALTYKTSIEIDKNWKLVAKTTSSGYQWIETPKLNLIGITVPVTPIANIALSQGDKAITAQIDQALAQMIDLRKYISEAWAELQKPMQVSQENNFWLRITPKDIYVSPFTTNGQKLNFAVSFYSQIESFMGAQPAAKALIPLPAYKVVQRPPQQFNVNVGADATYDKIAEMAKEQLINKTFAEGKRTITITGLSIYGSEGKPVFVADVTGSLKGRIYFTGELTYNQAKDAIEVQNPQFDLKTKNALVKSANWLLHGIILSKLTPYLSYPVKDMIEEMKAEANKTLSNYPVYDGVNLQGTITSVKVTSLNMVPGAVRVVANAKGNLALKIADLNF